MDYLKLFLYSGFLFTNTFFKKNLGLCADYALIVQFIRIYFLTRENLREESDEQLPLNTDDQVIHSTSENKISFDEFFPDSVSHPNQLILLILASILHLIGNIANSIWIRSTLA